MHCYKHYLYQYSNILMELNKIITGDALEELRKLPNESVDLVFTSPPYNLGNSHHTGGKKHQAYEDNQQEWEYQIYQQYTLQECFRILKAEGSVIYNHKNRIKKGKQITPYEWITKTPFVVKQELVWFNGSQNFDKIRFYPMTERIYWLAKSPATKLFNAINHHDLFNWKSVGTSGEHTRAFPIEMVTDILKCFPEAGIVLDPFLGSGTTALAAKLLGRNYIGIEKNPEYVKIAEDRLRQEQLF